MRGASLIVILAISLTGCNERFNSLAGPSDEARFATVSQASVAADASSPARGRKRAVAKDRLLQVEGIVKTASTDTLVVISSHGEEVTIKLDPATIIRHGNTNLTPADLHEGDRVHVKVKVVDGVSVAVEVKLQNPAEDPEEGSNATANGLVVSVGAEELTVRTVPRGDVLVRVDSNTIIKRQGDRIQLSEILVGWEVNTHGTRIDAQTIHAVQIEVRGNSKKK